MSIFNGNANNIENNSNKVSEINSSSTNEEYPSAKAIYDFVQNAVKDLTVSYGSWTPKFRDANLNECTTTYDYSYGNYYKIGKFVYITILMKGTITSISGTNYALLDVPFKSNVTASLTCSDSYNMASDTIYGAIIESGCSHITLQTTLSAGSAAASWALNQQGWLKVTGCYITE